MSLVLLSSLNYLKQPVRKKFNTPRKWSYFASLYFSYTSLLTIGYGDIYPQSNSGKPFFVFWSLLAVPSLTILISNMGDTIVKLIKDLTLWVGTFTVLPGEHGIRVALKENANRFSRGKLFAEKGDDVEPPGVFGEMEKRGEEDEDRNDPESAAQKVQSDRATHEQKSATHHHERHDSLPKSKTHYHHLLIKEISDVSKHLNSTPPRKYTFNEWAWYLKLMKEDEGSADTHRKALRRPRPDGEGLGVASGEEMVEWSWVGNRSPLMGGGEEAEWVLERLVGVLERELEAARREEEGEEEEINRGDDGVRKRNRDGKPNEDRKNR